MRSDKHIRRGARLEHGPEHAEDHARWSRRDFLGSMGLVLAGGSVMLAGRPVSTFARSELLSGLAAIETDRILVLVQLAGGNDGLNTVVPITNDTYYSSRPSLAIAPSATIPIPETLDLALHPSLAGIREEMETGRMALLQGVGYPEQQLSHFDSIDTWMSGAAEGASRSTGWLGRYLAAEFPDFDDAPTDFPLAVQLGGTSSLLFQAPAANMGMSLANPELFERVAEEGTLYTLEGLPATTTGDEIRFVRGVANDSFIYAEAIQQAAALGSNGVEYPEQTQLAENLAIVARLIKGGLGARVYHVSVGSFDTHANQGTTQGQHATLLSYLSDSIGSFLADLELGGHRERVLMATFSEFGRRIDQNGSGGTDHGSAAPLFIIGDGAGGGLYGELPDLTDLDFAGNPAFGIDFRSVYSTLLRDWFGMPIDKVAAVLGGAFESLGFVADPATPTASASTEVPAQTMTLHPGFPNPFTRETTIRFTIDQSMRVDLRVYDEGGRLVDVLVAGTFAAGTHTTQFRPAGELASGRYLVRLETEHGSLSRHATLVR